ncbi:MAG TPA: hypothetical protein IAC27_01185, partial [Candidatus Enterenecus avicola]|nr:hypothetical protein [Candidatus Enterenecus avicola]
MVFSDVVEEEAQSFRGPALAKGRSLRLDITPMLTLQGDEGAVRQLVSILVDNAVKYAPDGGEIRVQVARQGRSVRLVVSNPVETPISPQQLPHLFERFYRGDGARSGSGFGIGLSVAAAIVASHRGKIEAAAPSPPAAGDGDAAPYGEMKSPPGFAAWGRKTLYDEARHAEKGSVAKLWFCNRPVGWVNPSVTACAVPPPFTQGRLLAWSVLRC